MQTLFRTAEEAATCAVEQSAADGAPRYVIECTSQPADRRYRCDTNPAITDGERLVGTYRQGETAPDRPLVQPHQGQTATPQEIEERKRRGLAPLTAEQIETQRSRNPKPDPHQQQALTAEQIKDQQRRTVTPHNPQPALTAEQLEAQRRGKPDPHQPHALTPEQVEEQRRRDNPQHVLTPAEIEQKRKQDAAALHGRRP